MNIANALVLAHPGSGWGHMGGNDWSGWMWLWGTIMMLLWIAVIGVAVWLVIRFAGPRRDDSRRDETRPQDVTGTESARRILAERYARGEISSEEYDERLAKLR
ncbi:SHOCT domain-containing protein [Actinomadura formosensis]|uniref:SHOCT domain-containing protein n=1 Tax=Actinomadura formosensis TaxID=60706 RepID=UPI003D8BB350